MRRVRVLIVEDHAIVAEALERMLRLDDRIEVAARARTLSEAVVLLGRHAPDIVLLDLRLPDSKDYATIAAVKKACPHARIVVLTGAPGIEEGRALDEGAHAFLDKQADTGSIVKTVLSVVSMTSRALPPEDGLSPREMDVARLAASGLTNPEIGRALHISENTVKTHLAHVLEKLRLKSRVDLARILHGARAGAEPPAVDGTPPSRGE